MPTVDTLAALVVAHKWIPLAAAVIWLLVRLLKSDTKIPISIPPRWRPVLALAFGVVAGVLDKVAGGTPWRDALANGATAGVLAILAQVFGVDVLRGGKDVPMPASVTLRPPPPPPGIGGSHDVVIPKVPYIPPRNEKRTLRDLAALGCLAGVALAGCQALTPAQQKTIENGGLSFAELACVMSTELTDAEQVADYCKIQHAVIPWLRELIGQREAAKRNGAAWHTPTVDGGG